MIKGDIYIMNILSKIIEFIKSIKVRTIENKNTTVGGGVAGVMFAAIIKQIETASGCHFAEAFAGIDWMQIIGYAVMQGYGAMVTDGNKTIP